MGWGWHPPSESAREALWVISLTEEATPVWGCMRCEGRAFWDCKRVVRGCLGEEPKGGIKVVWGGTTMGK